MLNAKLQLNFMPITFLYAREPVMRTNAMLSYANNAALDSFGEDVLYEAQQFLRIVRLRTFKYDHDLLLRHADQHREVTFLVGDNVLV